MGERISRLRSLRNITTRFQVVDFYNELFRGGLTIDYCVVRSNAPNGLGRVFELATNTNTQPGLLLPIAFSMAYNNLSNATTALSQRANIFTDRVRVILISGDINTSENITFPNDTIICPYWNFVNSPPTSIIDVVGNLSWNVNRFAIVNINIIGNIIINSSSDFSMANSYISTIHPVRLRVAPNTNIYILNSEIVGPNPVIHLVKQGLIDANVNISRSTLSPRVENRSTIFSTEFNRGTGGNINVNMIDTRAFGYRLNNKIFRSLNESHAEINNTDDGELNVYWYNNVISQDIFDPPQSNIEYIARPYSSEDNEGNNFLINAIVLGDKEIDNKKFVKYRYMNKKAEVITNSKCIDEKE